MPASTSTLLGRSGVPCNADPILTYVPTEYGWQDVFWQGERIGMVKRSWPGKWTAVSACGSPEGMFGTRRAAGARLRRIIEGRRSA